MKEITFDSNTNIFLQLRKAWKEVKQGLLKFKGMDTDEVRGYSVQGY